MKIKKLIIPFMIIILTPLIFAYYDNFETPTIINNYMYYTEPFWNTTSSGFENNGYAMYWGNGSDAYAVPVFNGSFYGNVYVDNAYFLYQPASNISLINIGDNVTINIHTYIPSAQGATYLIIGFMNNVLSSNQSFFGIHLNDSTNSGNNPDTVIFEGYSYENETFVTTYSFMNNFLCNISFDNWYDINYYVIKYNETTFYMNYTVTNDTLYCGGEAFVDDTIDLIQENYTLAIMQGGEINGYVDDLYSYQGEYIPLCEENWVMNYTECINNNETKYYVDNNNCGTYNNLPLDNNTIIPCGCFPLWTQNNTLCNGTSYVIRYIDLNNCNTTNWIPLDNNATINCEQINEGGVISNTVNSLINLIVVFVIFAVIIAFVLGFMKMFDVDADLVYKILIVALIALILIIMVLSFKAFTTLT